MKIAITGALGGVGRALVEALRHDHEVTGVVGALQTGDADGLYVAFGDKPALRAAMSVRKWSSTRRSTARRR